MRKLSLRAFKHLAYGNTAYIAWSKDVNLDLLTPECIILITTYIIYFSTPFSPHQVGRPISFIMNEIKLM